jgi:hypothetical protein
MSPTSGTSLPHKPAHFYGVLTEYYDVAYNRRQASVKSLLAVLRALGLLLRLLVILPECGARDAESCDKRCWSPLLFHGMVNRYNRGTVILPRCRCRASGSSYTGASICLQQRAKLGER